MPFFLLDLNCGSGRGGVPGDKHWLAGLAELNDYWGSLAAAEGYDQTGVNGADWQTPPIPLGLAARPQQARGEGR